MRDHQVRVLVVNDNYSVLNKLRFFLKNMYYASA